MHKVYFALIPLLYLSCSGRQATEQQKPIDVIDSIALLQVVADDFISKLQGQVVSQKDLRKNGDIYLEFSEDTTTAEHNDVVQKILLIIRQSLQVGDLNLDGSNDFAIRTLRRGMGNSYSFDWHIYLQHKDGYKAIDHALGPGKFSSSEDVDSIHQGVLSTRVTLFNKERVGNELSTVRKQYVLKGEELVLK